VLDQYAKGLYIMIRPLASQIREKLERLKCHCGMCISTKLCTRLIYRVAYLQLRRGVPKFKQLAKAVEEFRTYIKNNGHLSRIMVSDIATARRLPQGSWSPR